MIERPRTTLVLVGIVTLALGAGGHRLELEMDGGALAPRHAPEVLTDHEIRERFGFRDPLVVAVHPDHPDGIFNPATLAFVEAVTETLRASPGIDAGSIVSLATESSDRHRSGTLAFARLLEPFPADSVGLARLRDDLGAIRIYTGTLAAADGRATAVFVGVPPEVDRAAFAARVETVVERLLAHHPGAGQVAVIGAPVAEARLGAHILDELRVLVPVAIVLMALVFAAAFRRASAVALPLMEVGGCLVATFGLMGWMGTPVYLTIAVLPVILTMIGVADEIHVFTRYAQLGRTRREAVTPRAHAALVRDTLREVRSPVVKTSLTTAIGFLSFALSPIEPVRAFGLYMAFGVLFCLAWTLTAVPALLVLWPSRGRIPWPERVLFDGRRFSPLRLPVAVPIALAAVLAVAAGAGISRIVVQDSWIEGFAETSELRRATEAFNAAFFGTHVLLVEVSTARPPIQGVLDERFVGDHRIHLDPAEVADPAALIGCRVRLDRTAPHPPDRERSEVPSVEAFRRGMSWSGWIVDAGALDGRSTAVTARRDGSPRFHLRLQPGDTLRYTITHPGLLWPETLERVDAFEAFLDGQRALTVGGVVGPAEYVRTTSYMVSRRRLSARTVPDDPDRIEWLWSRYGTIRGEDRVREILSETRDRGLVAAYLGSANYVDVKRLLEAIDAYADEHLRPHGIDVRAGGDVAVSQALISGIVDTQVRSLVLSLAGILLVTSILHRSLRWGVICVVPAALAILCVFGLMGWAGVPLGVSTSMFAGMTLGIGVDFSIHLVERYRRERREGASPAAAAHAAWGVVGPPIVIDAVAIALGFGVLAFSEVPANARLGLLAVACVAGAWLGAAALTPILAARR